MIQITNNFMYSQKSKKYSVCLAFVALCFSNLSIPFFLYQISSEVSNRTEVVKGMVNLSNLSEKIDEINTNNMQYIVNKNRAFLENNNKIIQEIKTTNANLMQSSFISQDQKINELIKKINITISNPNPTEAEITANKSYSDQVNVVIDDVNSKLVTSFEESTVSINKALLSLGLSSTVLAIGNISLFFFVLTNTELAHKPKLSFLNLHLTKTPMSNNTRTKR